MRVSREQAVENREKILHTATRLFREKGFGGIGIADLMKATGLTHGGFYGHFSSKEDLMAQACTRSIDELLEKGQKRDTSQAVDPFIGFVDYYLSSEHRDNPGYGCLMAALGTEAPRQPPLVRTAFTQGAKRVFSAFVTLLGDKESAEKTRETALVTLATLVGAQVIARAVDDGELSQEVLQTVLQHVKNSRSG